MLPQIDCPSHISLPPNSEIILRQMFATYQRIVIKRDFTSLGYSGSWVYEVSLIKNDGDDLPVVVKIAAVSLIEKEGRAYQACIKDKWLHVAAWRGEPVFHGELGGLAYTLVGGGIFPIQSLREYCLSAEMSDIEPVLQRLFKLMKAKILLPATARREYRLRKSYDAVLPVNLLIEHLALSEDEKPILITPNHLPRVPLRVGTCVQLEGFIVTKVDLPDQSMTLNLPADSQNAYRLRLNYTPGTFEHELSTFQIGHPLPPLTGKVIETRASCFRKELQALSKALGATFDPTSEELTLPDGTALPNPLVAIPSILKSTRNLKFNHIHGDLNLENVLVDAEVRDFRLIDFAEARYEHVLHDFLRLETEVITKLLPTALADANLPAEAIVPFYQQLHCATFLQAGGSPAHQALDKPFAILSAIRQAARDGFYDPAEFSEYYECLTLYLVGVLRFWNLDSVSKEVAFWGAATVQQLLATPPDCFDSEEVEEVPPLAIMISVDPVVQVTPAGTNLIQPAKFGMYLQHGDRVMTFENGMVSIACKNGLLISLFENRNWTVNCRPEVEESIQLSPILTLSLAEALDVTDGGRSLNWPRSGKRGRSRSKQANMPILLTPRNTLIADPRPTFRWQPVVGASGYRVRVIMRRGKGWQRDTTDPYLPYPDDEPALLPGDKRNIVTVATLDNLRVADQGWLRVMDESSRRSLARASAALQTLEVDEVAKRYLLAQLYRQSELYSAAIRELEYLTETQQDISANLWQQLGDLYLEVQLYAQAEERYQAVLNATDARKQIQASAYVGLARVAHAAGNTQQALDVLTTAETLYQEAGNVEQATLIAAQKSNLSSN